MNPGIFYLYEYENNSRRRNVGFIKVSRHFQSCILQIHARGIPVGNGASLELIAFFRDGEHLIGTTAAILNCFSRNISVRLPISESRFPNQKPLSEIDGFLLLIPGSSHHIFWMVSPVLFIPDIRLLRQPDSEETQSVHPPEETPDLLPDNAPDENKHEPEIPHKQQMPESEQPSEENILQPEVPHQDNIPDPEIPSQDDIPDPEEPNQDDIPHPECPHKETISESEQFPEENKAEPEHSPKTPYISHAELQHYPDCSARKISREDIRKLPRCLWRLADNSFLLHGYHNYSHLLLVEEDGHRWLGVPGIYDDREARAADLFGFPQFTRSYTGQLDLSSDECNNQADFGYWCRCIDTR